MGRALLGLRSGLRLGVAQYLGGEAALGPVSVSVCRASSRAVIPICW